jgi:hypothetical protein
VHYPVDAESEYETKIKGKKIATDVCKALGIWDTIGKKWSLLILRHLAANDNMHFNQLKRLLGSILSPIIGQWPILANAVIYTAILVAMPIMSRLLHTGCIKELYNICISYRCSRIKSYKQELQCWS